MHSWTGPGDVLIQPDHREAGVPPARYRAVVLLAATVAVAARVALLRVPLSSDEAGFLIIGAQWHPGHSLYGNYWVDRPPGLIAIFSVADAWGGQVALRLIGALVAASSVLAAAWLAKVVADRQRGRPAVTAVLVAALLSSALLDVSLVDGEILALPFVMVGLTALLLAARPLLDPTIDSRSHGWAVLAGACGATAVLIKQNFVEVAVATLVVGATVAVRRNRHSALLLLGVVSAGAAAAVAGFLAFSVARGTSLSGLWYATVVFRIHASAVIAASATHATTDRAHLLVGAALLSGAPLALLLFRGLPWRRRSLAARSAGAKDPARTWLCLAIVTTEVSSIALGGSYWLHYLVQVVPGVALLAATASARSPARAPAWRPGAGPAVIALLATVVSSAAASWALEVAHPRVRTSDEQAVIGFLRAHADRGRSVVVAYGNAGLVRDAGMTSPYPDLWSLPVRVRDPHLVGLTQLLDGPAGPEWVVVQNDTLDSWGIVGAGGDLALSRHYRAALMTPTYEVFQAAG